MSDNANINHSRNGLIPGAETIVIEFFKALDATSLVIKRLTNLPKATCRSSSNGHEHALDLRPDEG